jgi:hypothetical protein
MKKRAQLPGSNYPQGPSRGAGKIVTPTTADVLELIDRWFPTDQEASIVRCHITRRQLELRQPVALDDPAMRRELTKVERVEEWQAVQIAEGEADPAADPLTVNEVLG